VAVTNIEPSTLDGQGDIAHTSHWKYLVQQQPASTLSSMWKKTLSDIFCDDGVLAPPPGILDPRLQPLDWRMADGYVVATSVICTSLALVFMLPNHII
jgi:hypothetical protein